MKSVIHPHIDGEKAFPKAERKEIVDAISKIAEEPKNSASSKKKIRNAFMGHLHENGWSGDVTVSKDSGITVTSTKSAVGLVLQMGNMSRIYADLMKLQALYMDGHIKAAAFVVPSATVAKKLGSNIAASTRLIRELEIFRKVYTVPTLVFALEEQ
jgi:hypothetical protein